MFVQALTEKNNTQPIVRHRNILRGLSFCENRARRGLGSLPISQFERTFHNIQLARHAVAAVLLVGFFKVVKRLVGPVFLHPLNGMLVSLLGLFVTGACSIVLSRQRGESKGERQEYEEVSHDSPERHELTT